MIASARASYGARRWMAMSRGKSGGQVRSEIDDDRPGQRARELVERRPRGPDDGRLRLRHQRRRGRDVEAVALVVDRRRGHAGLTSSIRRRSTTWLVGRRRDGDGPAEVVGDPEAHGANHPGGAPAGVRLGWNAMRTLGITVVLALVLAWAPAAHAAAVHSCPPTVVHNKLAALATILSVRDMRCRTALGVVRRHGRAAHPGGVARSSGSGCSRAGSTSSSRRTTRRAA